MSTIQKGNKPVCVGCGKYYGAHWRNWPAGQQEPSAWDGQSWYTKYEPFCTLRCALAYARWVYLKYGHGRELVREKMK